jgi:hypothetical protein
MKKAAALTCLLALAAAAAAAQAWHPGTLEDALALARTQSKLVLVDFYSDG